MQRTPQVPPHPRRRPAHLSVSLRQGGPTRSSGRAGEQSWSNEGPNAPEKASSSIVTPVREGSDESNTSGDGVQNWFDRSNKRPAVHLHDGFEDSELSSLFPTKLLLDRLANQYFCKTNLHTFFANTVAPIRRMLSPGQVHICNKAMLNNTGILYPGSLIQLPRAVAPATLGV
jgi:hypothetical protein